VKPKEKNAKAEAGKQKKQLMILGGLVAVLGIVMAIQFGGSHPDAAAAALAQSPSDSAGIAQQLASDPAAAAAAAGMPAPAAPAQSAPSTPSGPVSDNPVLSSPVEGEGLLRSPFAGFWNGAIPSGGSGAVSGLASDIAPPSFVLNATMPSAQNPLAVIDGEVHTVGDFIQGWQLTEVQARRILLTSPSRATVALDMPLMSGAK
jgi:hypothetical protein